MPDLSVIKDYVQWIIIALVLYYLIVIITIVILKWDLTGSRGKADSMFYNFPAWIIPNKAIHDWVGYPDKYSQMSNKTPVYKVNTENDTDYTNSSPEECMLACAGDSSCSGFIFNQSDPLVKTGNCILVSDMGGFVPSDTSNTVFTKDAFTTGSQYVEYKSQIIPDPPSLVISAIQLDPVTNVAIITTSTPHTWATNDRVTISGASLPINGSNVITVIDTSNVSFPYVTMTAVTVNTGGAITRPNSTIPKNTINNTVFSCASNCYSNTACTSFMFNDTSKECTQLTRKVISTELVATTSTVNTYIPGATVGTAVANYY